MTSNTSTSPATPLTSYDCSKMDIKTSEPHSALEPDRKEMDITKPETAARKAMAIFELVEMVLAHLPPKDLIAAQRVSKTWKNVSVSLATKSPYLTTAFSTTPTPSKGYIDYSVYSSTVHYYQTKEYPSSKAICQIHPALRLETRHQDQLKGLVVSINPSYLLSWRPGSWREMFLTQPPIFRSDVYCFTMGAGNKYTMNNDRPHDMSAAGYALSTHETIKEEVPLTLGHLRDVAARFMRGRALVKSRFITPLKVIIKVGDGNRGETYHIAEESRWVTIAKEKSKQIVG